MAKRRGKGKAKPKAKVPPNNAAAEQEAASTSNEAPPTLMRKQSTNQSTSVENHTSLRKRTMEPVSPISSQTKPVGDLEKVPSIKRKRSSNATGNMHEEVPLKRSRSSTAKPSTSTQEVGNTEDGDPSASNHVSEKGSLKRNDTLIIEPSTSANPPGSFRVPALSMRSSIAGPSTSGQPFTTPKELIRIASLKRGLSRQEIVSILPAAASLSDQTLSSITQPSTSDPETRALIAESMELMRRASLRHSTSDDVPEVERDTEEETKILNKKMKLSMQKSKSQPKKADSLSEKTSVSRSQSVKGAASAHGSDESKSGDVEQPEMPPTSTDKDVVHEDRIDEDVQMVSEVHPDCDPVHIREQLVLVADDPFRVSTVTLDLFSATDIPTRADRDLINARIRRQQELLNMTLDVDKFFKQYPDPVVFFETDEMRVRSKEFVEHAHIFLKNMLPDMAATYMYTILRKWRNCLPVAYNHLKEEYDAWLANGRKPRNKKKYLTIGRTADSKYPDEINEEFYITRLYIYHRQEIVAQVNSKKEEIEQAKLEGKLRLCEICYIDDIMVDDMLPCQGGHLFCKECVKSSATEQIGQGRTTISCLESDCIDVYQLSALESILPAHQSAILLARMQTEEVKQADVEGLESCPFCPYAVVIPKEYPTNVLICQNPSCKMITCRSCKEVDHIPMTCDDFIVTKGKRLQEFIENSLSDAIIRECVKCHLRFFKEEGCNFMTCSSCGANMCYVCRQLITGYDHFRNSRDCAQYVNPELFHRAEVLEAYNQIGDRFHQAHPEMGNMEIPDIYRPDDV